MPRQNELEKTWLPGPARGTQTFNAPANLAIDYGRHVATVSGRGGSGNNPGAAYSILYNTNYNLVYPQANQPEVSRPVVNYNTNYNLAYPIAARPEVSRPINAYNANYNIAYPFTPGPANYSIVYETVYNTIPVADTYGVNYSVAYPATYNVVYPISGYNTVNNISGYNVAYPVAGYNVVYTITGYNVVYPVAGYNIAYPVTGYNAVPVENSRPIANQPGTGTYNPATSFNWLGGVQIYSEVYDTQNQNTQTNNVTESNSGSNVTCPSPQYTTNYEEYANINIYTAYYIAYECTPVGNNQNYNTNYNIAYNVVYPAVYNVVYPATYNTVYPANYSFAYPATYNVAYPANYVFAYPANYNIAYPVTYNVAYPFTGYNTNYNLAYPIAAQPEVSRPVIGNNAAYNIAYPLAGYTPVYSIVYETNYNTLPVVASYGANYSIVYQTNYNTVPVVANTPEASRPIVGYSPGVPGTPTNVLGVYFPGGPVGLPAPYVPETTVVYWDYPDFQTHPVSVPSGGEIVVKLE